MILINSSPKTALKIFQPFLPIFVPVGIGCLIAAAERKGLKVRFIDEQFEDNIIGIVERYIKEMDEPYIFGFSVLTSAFNNAITLSKELKRRYPDSMIVFGGIHPTAVPDETLSFDHVDVVLRGEAEHSLMEFYDCVKNKKDFTHLDNLSYRRNGSIVHNKTNFIAEDLKNYPGFPYHIFDSKRYDLGFILSSRGCPYDCIFCSNRVTTGRKYRFRSAEAIIDELDMLYSRYNRKYVLFVDDNLIVNKERIYAIIDAIKTRGLHKKMTFNFQARADSVSYKLLVDLYDAGFRSVFFGLESSSNRILKIIKKNETVEECIEAVKMAKKAGFYVSATYMYGLPGETYEDRMGCVSMTKELGLDMVRYNNATPYPGTELYNIAKQEKRLCVDGLYKNFISVSTFIENPFRKIPFSYVPQENTEPEIRRDILFSFFSFYLNIDKLKKVFMHPDKGAGWFKVGESLREVFKKIPALIFLGLMLWFKFCQLFYYTVIKKETRISFKKIIQVFTGVKKQGG